MRLLKTGPYVPGHERLEVIQIWGESIPPYAILSHTWSTNPDNEVLLSDVQNGNSASKSQYAKLEKALERAKLDGYGWLWDDTCCIDKSSSVELSEAINSMYAYYANAEKCYAYLVDVESAEPGEEFTKSRWWTRGWTLQELLAPRKVEFFNKEWKSIGYKDDLHAIITSITGIEHDYLANSFPVSHASIAKRMSWASARRTTREEDLAYCMLGIFDVNMPMLYGEGGIRAFLRLQEEIMKGNEDQSLFAWIKSDDNSETQHRFCGMLATSPRDFSRTGDTIPYTDRGDFSPSTITARGLHLTLPLTPKPNGTMIAALQCTAPGMGYNGWLAVYLKETPTGRHRYGRVECNKLASVSELGKLQEVYVQQQFQRFPAQIIYPYHFFRLRTLACSSDHNGLDDYRVVDIIKHKSMTPAKNAPIAPPEPWSSVALVHQMNKVPASLTLAALIKRTLDQEAFVLMLGTSSDFAVGISVREASAFQSLASMQKTFVPHPPGEFAELKYHSVRVKIEDVVRNEQKIHLVDVEINAYPHPPTAVDLLEGVATVVTAANQRAPRVELLNKVKRIIPRRESGH